MNNVSKANHSRLLTTLRDVIQTSTADENLEFICGTLTLFDKCYGAACKDAFRKMINETLVTYGPSTIYESDERLLPVYILLGKYSRSSTSTEIFEKLHTGGTYKHSAHFYAEWSRIELEMGNNIKAKTILQEGLKRKARPLSLIEAQLRLMGIDIHANVQMPSQIRQILSVPPAEAPRSAKKKLFAENRPPSQSTSGTIVMPLLPNNITAPAVIGRAVQPRQDDDLSPLPMPPMEFKAHTPGRSPAIRRLQPQPPRPAPMIPEQNAQKEDAENMKPSNMPDEPVTRRRINGVLVPAAGFDLDDYDFYKKDEEEEERKTNEQLRAVANRQNIRNNQPVSDMTRIDDPTTLADTSDFVLPPLPGNAQSSSSLTPVVEAEEEFMSGSAALAGLEQISSDDDDMENNRRLTAFEQKLNQKNQALQAKHRLSMANIERNNRTNQRVAEIDMEAMFGRMGINSPGTSKNNSTP